MPAKLGMAVRISGPARTRSFFIDPEAAAQLIELREKRGLSPERLAELIEQRAEQEGWEVGAVHASTIRRMEGDPGDESRPGVVPSLRVQVVMALFHNVDRRDIWKPGRQIKMRTEVKEQTAA